MSYEYKIGTTLGGMVTLESLGVPAPEQTFVKYSQSVQLGDGTSKGVGWPSCEWRFGFLTETQRDALKAYCPNASAEVFIRTFDEDLDYQNYECVLIWPSNGEERTVGASIDVTLQFQRMVQQ